MDAGVLIPIIAVSTGLVAVFGRTILKPILQSLQQQPDTQRVRQLESKIEELEARLAGTETSVDTLLDERAFMRSLAAGRTTPAAAIPPDAAATEPTAG